MEIEELALGEPPEEFLVLQRELDGQDLLGRAAGRQIPIAVGLQAVVLETAGRQAQGSLEPTDELGHARESRSLYHLLQRIERPLGHEGDGDVIAVRERAQAELQPVSNRLVR